MKSIYKKDDSKFEVIQLYDKQLAKLTVPYKDLYIDTSFGAGVLAKMMCVSPEKIEKSVLVIPSGIMNAPAYKSIAMSLPMVMYWITSKESWL